MHGGKREGAGRKLGRLGQRARDVIAAAAESGETPAEYMLRVMRNPNADEKRRDAMAIAAAPYFNARLASVEHSGELSLPRTHEEALAEMEEAAKLANRSSPEP